MAGGLQEKLEQAGLWQRREQAPRGEPGVQNGDILRKIAFLSDETEMPFFLAIRELKGFGISQLTPCGVLYLLTRTEATASKLEAITGQKSSVISEKAKAYLIRNYQGQQGNIGIEFTPEIGILIDQAIKEAGGGVNRARTEHLIAAMFSMSNAKRGDAFKVLAEMGITEAKIREGAGGMGIFTDKTSELVQSNSPYLEVQTLKDNIRNVFTALTSNGASRILVTGERGSGARTLLKGLAMTMTDKEQFKGLSRRRILEIDEANINKLFVNGEEAKKLKETLKDAILYIDLDRVPEETAVRLIESRVEVPILAIGCSKIDEGDWKEKSWHKVKLKEYTPTEIRDIVKRNFEIALFDLKIGAEEQDKVVDLLIKFGSALSNKALPGAAIDLLNLYIAEVGLDRGNKLTLEKLTGLIARHGNISAELLLKTMAERVDKLEEILGKRIIGQDEAKHKVKRALKRRAEGLGDEKRPMGSFVFLGPTGVGKTELAKALAEAIFGSEDSMTRIDMSEYQERHSDARLIGSPPGYVGHEEGGQLTKAVKEKPFSVVLFDEIDKAHPDVLNVLLQVLEDGRLTDGKGNTVDFRNTIIIMTSNHGSDLFYEALARGEDIGRVKREVLSWVGKVLRPELLNRFDGMIVFDPLTKEQSRGILDLLVNKMVVKPLREQRKIEVTLTERAKVKLLDLGFDQKLGARPLRRAVNEYILDSIIDIPAIRNGDRVICDVDQAGNIITRKQ